MPSAVFTADRGALRRTFRALRTLSPGNLDTARRDGIPYAEAGLPPAIGDHLTTRWTPPLGPAVTSGAHLNRRLRALSYPPCDGSATAAAYADLMTWVSVITSTSTPPLPSPPLQRAQPMIAPGPPGGHPAGGTAGVRLGGRLLVLLRLLR